MRHSLLVLCAFAGGAQAATPLMESGPYAGFYEKNQCEEPATILIEAKSPDNLGYMNAQLQAFVEQAATLAWLECPGLDQFQVQAFLPPATQAVMDFPVRLSSNFAMAASPPESVEAKPTPQAKTENPARDWHGQEKPPMPEDLAEAINKPRSAVDALSSDQQKALMELASANAGNLDALKAIFERYEMGSRSAGFSLVDLFRRAQGNAEIDNPDLLESLGLPSEVAANGAAGAARHILNELGQQAAQASDVPGLFPGLSHRESLEVVETAFGEALIPPPTEEQENKGSAASEQSSEDEAQPVLDARAQGPGSSLEPFKPGAGSLPQPSNENGTGGSQKEPGVERDNRVLVAD